MVNHVVIFGNVSMVRALCKSCEGFALVGKDGKFRCCGELFLGAIPVKTKREVEPEYVRRLPSPRTRRKKLDEQDNLCAYCDRKFGSRITWRNRARVLKAVWDHLVPYSYSADNREENFLAACQICNGNKSSTMFRTMDEARTYLQTKIVDDIVFSAVRRSRRSGAISGFAPISAG